MTRPVVLFSGLIIAVALLSLGVLASPSVPLIIGQTATQTSSTTTYSTYTKFTVYSTTLPYTTTYRSSGCFTDVAVTPSCFPFTFTFTFFIYPATTTSWQVASATTYTMTSQTTMTSTSYHTNTVPPYAYYGLSGETFAGVVLVVLVLCGALGFYAMRSGKKHGQAKITHFVSKTRTCITCRTILASCWPNPVRSKFCTRCGSLRAG